MEAQLAAYRARKAKEHNSTTSSLFSSMFRRASVKQSANNAKDKEETDSDSSESKVFPSTPPPVPLSAPPPDAAVFSYRSLTLLLHPTFLKVILWFILWGLFIELEFGAVYFVISSLYIIYANTRTGPKADGSLSAYSVFNPNYERLEGTFTSEQFEKELRYGAAAVH